jgi:hypothetical protein
LAKVLGFDAILCEPIGRLKAGFRGCGGAPTRDGICHPDCLDPGVLPLPPLCRIWIANGPNVHSDGAVGALLGRLDEQAAPGRQLREEPLAQSSWGEFEQAAGHIRALQA